MDTVKFTVLPREVPRVLPGSCFLIFEVVGPAVVAKAAIVEGPVPARVGPSKQAAISGGYPPTSEPERPECETEPDSQDVDPTLHIVWRVGYALKPDTPVEVPVAVKPPTVPEHAKTIVPKVFDKVIPATDPEVVPEGVTPELNSLDIFATLPEGYSA